ncbi:MAG: CAP domain-containing protein [Lachnospiraceae bacterium]|nr:CAP domain-containing protein [Lachnospiraceae bacterium]
MNIRKPHMFRDMRALLLACLVGISIILSGCTGSGQLQSTQTESGTTKGAASKGSDGVIGFIQIKDSEALFENMFACATEAYEAELEKSLADDKGKEKKSASDDLTEDDLPDTVSAPPEDGMFDETEDAAHTVSDIEEAQDKEGLEDKTGEVTYYDRQKASKETKAAVSELVMSETGGKAGYITSYQSEIISMVNELRANAGLQTLIWDNGAQQVANIRATEIAGYSEHTRPDGSPWYTVFGQYNIQPIPSGAGENIAGGQITPREVLDSWLASPGHYANIMRPEFNGIGVGCYFNPDSDYKFYWVQTFVTR